jgi:diadenosine tetraphosphate (Ap4A) HIT family hydrolase
MFKEHYEELYQIPKSERDVYLDDVCALAETITELYHADKINYGIYGDCVRHVHFTFCPKYKGKIGWGGTFEMFRKTEFFLYTGRISLADDSLRAALLKKRGIQV